MNFGEMNIHDLNKDKNYIIEITLNKMIPVDELDAYLRMVKNTFRECGINNCVFIPTGSEMYIEKLNITENN